MRNAESGGSKTLEDPTNLGTGAALDDSSDDIMQNDELKKVKVLKIIK